MLKVPISSHTAKSYLIEAGLLIDRPLEKHDQPHSKLTAEEARHYRERYAKGEITKTALAEEAGISLNGMCRLLSGKSYAHAGGPLCSKPWTVA